MDRDRDKRETLFELLEWRRTLPGWQSRLDGNYLDELRRLCAQGRLPVHGRPVLDRFGWKKGELQLVPETEFYNYRLSQEALTNHGGLFEGLTPVWADLRFPGNTRRVWQAALEAGELMAPREASGVGTEAAPIAVVPTKAPEPFAAAQAQRTAPKRPRGKPPAVKNRLKAEMRNYRAKHGDAALNMKQDALAALFGSTGYWCAVARKEVLKEISATEAGSETVADAPETVAKS